MQITPEHIIFLLVILTSQYRQTEAFYRSTAMCSSKRISCLSKTSFRFCFQAGSGTYSYGRTKHCPYGSECNEVKGKYACVEDENRLSEFQSTPASTTNLWVTEFHGNSENEVNEETNTPWTESAVPVWTEVSISPSIVPMPRTTNSGIFTIPITTDSSTIGPTTNSWTEVVTRNTFVTSMENQKTTFTNRTPDLEIASSNYTGENPQKKTSYPPISSLTNEPISEFNEITTRKIRRKKKPSPSKPKRRKKPTKLVGKPTKLVGEPKTTTLSSSTYQTSIIENSTFSVTKRQPTTPLKNSSTTATTLYSKSIKPPKRRRKKPQKSSTTTLVPPTSTEKPATKLKKKKKPQKTSTTLSVTQMTSTSTATVQMDSTATIAEITSVGPAIFSSTTEISAVLIIPPVTELFKVSPASESPQIPSPSTTIISLSAPLPCPYYLNKLFSRSTSTTTQAAVSLTPPSSCRSTGKYPSKNCHEYFECLKVMWWYRLMIMKCKKGEGFDATLLQCIPDDTCV